ncbi:unnamed protein product [Lasius platythorax]|uniref:Uncharacterized protein n=1 Tax=Lasius platythorax TaxID=488582 RepID=A0AAV2MWL2_9HYME
MEERREMEQKRSCGWKGKSAGMIQEKLEQEKGEMVATEEELAVRVWKRGKRSVRRRGVEEIVCTGRQQE